MNRTGLALALAVAAAVGLVFGVWPELDLKLAGLFFDPAKHGFWRSHEALYSHLRDASTWLITLVAAPAVLAPVLKLLRPHRPLLIPGRAVVLMLVTLVLAPGVVANLILKDYWGRPRPIYVTEFGGAERFLPWWDLRGNCRGNCSFVAGEPSGAFWTLAPAALAPPPWRAAAYGAALAFGAAVGALRMAAGAHFFTDVVFAGVFTFLIIWLAHGLIYRWPATRITDAAIERALARVSPFRR
jgi:membrane-associated PAP2 superfamily phosphatase